MTKIRAAFIFALGLAAGAVASYGYVHFLAVTRTSLSVTPQASAAERTILYYRDPTGAPFWSATPKNDAQGRAYLPVYDGAEPVFTPPPANPQAAQGQRKVRFYRNPMGLPDVSKVPKKDAMGMDYVPVYEGEDDSGGSTVKVSLEKVQRSGVRTEIVARRLVDHPVRVPGTVRIDEGRIKVVTLRSEGFVEKLFVDRTGQSVRAGEPLFRVYSPEIQKAQIDLLIAMRPQENLLGPTTIEGAMQRLRNLGVPESRIEEVRKGSNPRTIDWSSPMTGVVLEKRILDGQRVMAGDELYRIADLSTVWIIADVPEQDVRYVHVGDSVTANFLAYPGEPFQGLVTFIYPDLKPETRTVRVRVELANADGRLKPDMYADVTISSAAAKQPTIAVPNSAVIDSGTRQVVLIAKGEGRFEPRAVKLGSRDDADTEIIEGVSEGEEVVTSATFLIDAESNLKAALQTFAPQEAPK
jgi:Cu(I)/Ag(I) efflux system membrane fusion protein